MFQGESDAPHGMIGIVTEMKSKKGSFVIIANGSALSDLDFAHLFEQTHICLILSDLYFADEGYSKHTVVFKKTSNVFEKTLDVFKNSS